MESVSRIILYKILMEIVELSTARYSEVFIMMASYAVINIESSYTSNRMIENQLNCWYAVIEQVFDSCFFPARHHVIQCIDSEKQHITLLGVESLTDDCSNYGTLKYRRWNPYVKNNIVQVHILYWMEIVELSPAWYSEVFIMMASYAVVNIESSHTSNRMIENLLNCWYVVIEHVFWFMLLPCKTSCDTMHRFWSQQQQSSSLNLSWLTAEVIREAYWSFKYHYCTIKIQAYVLFPILYVQLNLE